MGDDSRGIYTDTDLSNNDTDGFYFDIDFTNGLSIPIGPGTAGWMLGFRSAQYTVTRNPYVDIYSTPFETHTYHWYLMSESSYGSTVQNYLFLDLNDFSVYPSPSTNIISRIPIKSGMNTTVIIESDDMVLPTREYMTPITLSKLQIRLLNKYGTPVAMNGNDYSLVIEIEQ